MQSQFQKPDQEKQEYIINLIEPQSYRDIKQQNNVECKEILTDSEKGQLNSNQQIFDGNSSTKYDNENQEEIYNKNQWNKQDKEQSSQDKKGVLYDTKGTYKKENQIIIQANDTKDTQLNNTIKSLKNIQMKDIVYPLCKNAHKKRYSVREYINEQNHHNPYENPLGTENNQLKLIWLPFQEEFKEIFMGLQRKFNQRHDNQESSLSINLTRINNNNNNTIYSVNQKKLKSRRKQMTCDNVNLQENEPIQNIITKTASITSNKASESDRESDRQSSFSSPNRQAFKNKYALNSGLRTRDSQISNISQRSQYNDSQKNNSQGDASMQKSYMRNSDKIKQYNISSKLDLRDPEISQIAISILQKIGKTSQEIKFLQKCIEGMPLFQKNQGLFEKSNSLHHFFSQIKHVKYQKNHVIFNFGEYGYHYYIVLKGSVLCLIPDNQYKEELIQKQKKIEYMQQKLKRLQSKNKNSVFQQQECGKQFIDIVMLAYKQKQEVGKQQKNALLKEQGKPVMNPNIQTQKKKSKLKCQSPQGSETMDNLKQNQLFTQFLQKKGINIKQTPPEKQPFLGRRSNVLETDSNIQSRQINKNQNSYQNSSLLPFQNSQLSETDHQDTQKQQKIAFQIPQDEIMNDQLHQKKDTLDQSEERIILEKDDMLDNETQKEYLLRKFPEFFLVKSFLPGESFGEIALMTKERRTATMVCQEETHLMVLSKEGFDRIIGAFQQQIMREKLDFLKGFQFLDSLPMSQLMSLLHYFKINTYAQKSVIYNQGDKVTDIFFIKSGEVEVLKSVLIEDEEYQQSQREFEQSKRLYEMNLSLKQRMKSKKSEMVPIKLLGPGQCFGEEEVILDNEKRTHRVVVTQHAEIFSIPKDVTFYQYSSIFYLAIYNNNQIVYFSLLEVIKRAKHSPKIKLSKDKLVIYHFVKFKVQERENFITQKKAENNNKIKEELQMFENKQLTKLDYNQMQKGFQRQSSSDSQQEFQLQTYQRAKSISPLKTSTFSRQASINTPTKLLKTSTDNQSELNSPSIFSPLTNKNYPLLDSFILNNSHGHSLREQSSKDRNSPQIVKQGSSSLHSEQQSPLISPTIFSGKNKSLLSQNKQDSLIESKMQESQVKKSQKTIERNSPQILPNISLLDYKPQEVELEFKSHSKYVEMQEMTTRSKVDNYSLLIKNKNQISDNINNLNDREAILVDLFKEVKKKKPSNSNQNINTRRNISSIDNSQTQHQSSKQISRQPSIIFNIHQNNNRTLSNQRSVNQKLQGSNKLLFSQTLNSSQFKQKEQQNENDINQKKQQKELHKEIAITNLNKTGFSAFKINQEIQKPLAFSSSPHSLQQHLKKGTSVNYQSQNKPTHFVAQKHITEFTRDVRNRESQMCQTSLPCKKREYLQSQSLKKSFISQIDFADILNDQVTMSMREQSPQIQSHFNNEDFGQIDFNNSNGLQKYPNEQDSLFEQYKAQSQKQKIKNNSIDNEANFFLVDPTFSSYRSRQKSMEQDDILKNTSNFQGNKSDENFNILPSQKQINNFSNSEIKNELISRYLQKQPSQQEKINFNAHSSTHHYTFATLFNTSDVSTQEKRQQTLTQSSIISSQGILHRRNFSQLSQNKMNIPALQLDRFNNQNSQIRLSNNLSQKSINSNDQQFYSSNTSNLHTDTKNSCVSYQNINKDMKRAFKLDKIIQNEAEKNFIKLAQMLQPSSQQQQLQQQQNELKLKSNIPSNLNSLRYILASSLTDKERDKHNQRLLDLRNQKMKMNQNTQINKQVDIAISAPSSTSNLQRKIYRQQLQKQISQANNEDNIMQTNLQIQQASLNKPS